MIEVASRIAADADIFLVVGTSLVVYPAAGLIHYVRREVPKFVVDPNLPDVGSIPYATMIAEKASVGMEMVKQKLAELL
jgi:NAD-dependent deacetylase